MKTPQCRWADIPHNIEIGIRRSSAIIFIFPAIPFTQRKNGKTSGINDEEQATAPWRAGNFSESTECHKTLVFPSFGSHFSSLPPIQDGNEGNTTSGVCPCYGYQDQGL
jgi:hypothetical protein